MTCSRNQAKSGSRQQMELGRGSRGAFRRRVWCGDALRWVPDYDGGAIEAEVRLPAGEQKGIWRGQLVWAISNIYALSATAMVTHLSLCPSDSWAGRPGDGRPMKNKGCCHDRLTPNRRVACGDMRQAESPIARLPYGIEAFPFASAVHVKRAHRRCLFSGA